MYHSFPKDEQNAPLADGDAPEATPRRLSTRARLGIALLLVAILGFAGFKFFGGAPAQADTPPPATVTVAQPLQRTITEWDDYTGRFEASQSVEIRPRVSGQLVGVHFRDGDLVRRGQLLFTIDPRPYQAALAEARARLAAAQSAVALANSEYARAARLVDDEAVSREEVESLRAQVRSTGAAVAAAQAVVRQRQLDLEFTRVTAPITGRASDRRIDRGNIVAANESLLTTVLALDPIYFAYDGSEALALRARRAGTAASEVQIRLQDETDYRHRGRVDFTDNAIDAGSGTLRGRAVLPNPDLFLTPGMFGNMRLAAGGPRNALLIPDAAVQTDQARKIVLVVEADGKVGVRPVELGARIGTLRSIRAGLRPTDRVIVEGVQYARPGTPVNVRTTRITMPAAAPARAYPAPAAASATIAG
ncbi:MAG TPA: efflux RND transporter periplasmic adaptor subunit [Allosphingosinicella sp.]|nr:efflux RND transporter periplasmic adaptor subunit [Allosphingosinicella sp.]